jgi:two-component sensor histidine kinase
MQKNSTNNEEIKKALEECRSRVYSISLLHQKLIQPQTQEVDITGYIMDICSEFRKSLPEENKIMFELNLQPVRMKISQAIPLGLIINELMTNSYKHNSALNEIMKIQISLDADKNKILFKYADSGKTKNIKEGNGNNSEKNVNNKLGTVIIESLSEQLDAVLHTDVSDGYYLSMEIPLMN